MTKAQITHAYLGNVLNRIDVATSYADQIKCGRDMLGIKTELQQRGLTIRSAYELYFRDYFTGRPELIAGDAFEQTRPDEVVQQHPNQQQSNETAQNQTNGSQQTPNGKYHDPQDVWVIPWTHAMDHAIGNRPLNEGDMEHILIMQGKRYRNARSHKHLVWLHDICRRNNIRIPNEYWDWWSSLTPEEQDAATRR